MARRAKSISTQDLIKYRNHLPAELVPLCDRLIYEACRHIPGYGEVLADPPPPQPTKRMGTVAERNKCIRLIDRLEVMLMMEELEASDKEFWKAEQERHERSR